MSKPLWELRQKVAKLMGETLVGTPTGSYASNTFGCLALTPYPDDYFNDWQGRFYSGTHAGISFVVTDFTQAGGIVEFKPSQSIKTDATDLFELLSLDFSAEEMNAAINLTISMVEKEALQDKTDETLKVIASTYEYPIPTGFLYLEQIFQESGTANRYSASADLVDVRHWRILRGTTPKIWFDNSWISLTAGRKLRLVGQEAQAQLATDSALCEVSPAFLTFQAKALLHQSRIRGSGADFEEHRSQQGLAQTLADKERSHIQVAGRGRKVIF